MKKNCLGCKQDKPESDFGATGLDKALCKSCRSGRVVHTSKGTARRGSDGNWVGDLVEGIFDAIGDILS